MSAKTDRDLLELAAKAAGLPLCSEWDAATDGILIGEGNGDLQVWNPLTDDGDALRLTVHLGITAYQYIGIVIAKPNRAGFTGCDENYGRDPAAATRRAIVRAAAAIGELL